MRRIFLIVLDSFGIGEMEDAGQYGDIGANTLYSVSSSPFFHMPNMEKLGLFQIDGVKLHSNCKIETKSRPEGVVARMKEASKGKDTTTGHWEMAGLCLKQPFPTYPHGFPEEILKVFSEKTGRGNLCNRPYSGTEVIQAYGDRHIETGDLIVYTSADSVFQVAAHEDVVPVETLYEYCREAREILQGKHSVGRVIARPFRGTSGHYERTKGRHDFSLRPTEETMLVQLEKAGFSVIGIGKIKDIFAGEGITEFTYTGSNEEGIAETISYLQKDFEGLCFINLVDYDMLYGHRNDIDGYAKALRAFDEKLPAIIKGMKTEDILMITADHGCDPGFLQSTDHSREYTPFLMYQKGRTADNMGTRNTFADIGATVLDYFDIKPSFEGTSMLNGGKKRG